MAARHTRVEDVGRRCTVRGATYHEQLRRQIPFLDCRLELTAGSMTTNRRKMHGTKPEIDWNQLLVSQTEHILQVFNASFRKGTYQCQ